MRENNRKVLSDRTSSKTVVLDEGNKDDLKTRYSLIYTTNTGEINIRTIITREYLVEKAIKAIEKACQLLPRRSTDLLMFQSQLYFEMGALKTMNLASTNDAHVFNAMKQLEHKKNRKENSEAENISSELIDENRQRTLKEVDELFTSSIVSLNKVLEVVPFHMVAMAVLGEVYFFWARSKIGIDSDKHFQNAIEIWTRLLSFPQYTATYNIPVDHISKMIAFTLEIRRGTIICDGMALKQGKLRKSWTERYFLLTIENFGYFQIKATKTAKKKTMKNNVPTNTIVSIKQNTEDKYTSNKDYPFCLEINCKKRTFYVCMASKDDLEKWESAFEYVILMNQIMQPLEAQNK